MSGGYDEGDFEDAHLVHRERWSLMLSDRFSNLDIAIDWFIRNFNYFRFMILAKRCARTFVG